MKRDTNKIAYQLVESWATKMAGADLYCPNCHENLGKQSEYEANCGCARGKKCQGFCGTCGEEFTFRAMYGS